MSDQVLMLGGSLIGFVVIAALIVVYFYRPLRDALLAKAARKLWRKPAPAGASKERPSPESAVDRPGGGALVDMVIDAQSYDHETDGQDRVYELDVLRVRVPDLLPVDGLGKKDGMSLLLQTEYFDMIKKMGASCREGR